MVVRDDNRYIVDKLLNYFSVECLHLNAMALDMLRSIYDHCDAMREHRGNFVSAR